MPIWRKLLLHAAEYADAFARFNTGISSAARIAMIAMTTSSSIKVKPLHQEVLWTVLTGARASGCFSVRMDESGVFFLRQLPSQPRSGVNAALRKLYRNNSTSV